MHMSLELDSNHFLTWLNDILSNFLAKSREIQITEWLTTEGEWELSPLYLSAVSVWSSVSPLFPTIRLQDSVDQINECWNYWLVKGKVVLCLTN
jgi:hypothetical protein